MIKTETKIAGPTNDIVFKIFFKKNREMLNLVIKEVIGIDIEKASIEFLDTETQGNFIDDKITRFDLRVKLPGGKVVYIEMQNVKQKELLNRMDFYLARVLTEQMQVSGKYQNLKSVYGIFFLNYNSEEFNKMFTKLEICDKLNLEKTYDNRTMYVINLKQVEEDKRFDEDFIRLLKFITLESSKEMSDMARVNDKFEKAYKLVQDINADPEYRDYIWQKEKDKWDKEAELDYALSEGHEKGKAEGILEGKAEGILEGKAENTKELVLKMHQNNLDLETISKITQMPIEEINSIIE